MKVELHQNRKAPNKAAELVLASANLAASPIVSADWTAESCGQLMEALRTVWQDEARLRRCKVENLRIESDERYRKTESEPYHIWFVWGTSNGGGTFATLTLTPT